MVVAAVALGKDANGKTVVVRDGKEYGVQELSSLLNISPAAAGNRIRRYADSEIHLEQVFSKRVTRNVFCPISGATLFGVDPAEMPVPMYFVLVDLIRCSQKHYSQGMCRNCYYVMNPDQKAGYEQTEAGRERRNRNNARPETKEIKKFSRRKITLAQSIEPKQVKKPNALKSSLQQAAVSRFKVTETEGLRLADAAVEYWQERIWPKLQQKKG